MLIINSLKQQVFRVIAARFLSIDVFRPLYEGFIRQLQSIDIERLLGIQTVHFLFPLFE